MKRNVEQATPNARKTQLGISYDWCLCTIRHINYVLTRDFLVIWYTKRISIN